MIKLLTELVYCLLVVACRAQLVFDESFLQDGADESGRPRNDPNFKPVESHYLTFPLTSRDYEHWNTLETSVILGSRVVVAPETEGARGILHSTFQNPKKDTWIARIDFSIVREKAKRKDWVNGGGFAIHYLRTVDEDAPKPGAFYGYDDDDFDGFAVQINPTKTKKISKT